MFFLREHEYLSSYVIDRSGIVHLIWTGEINRETLEKYVTPLLADH